MKNNRHNIFEEVHKKLTSHVFNTCIGIQQTDFSHPVQSKHSIDLMEKAIWVFNYHIIHVDARIYEAIVQAAPYIVAMMEENDLKDTRLIKTIIEKLDEYQCLSMKQGFEDFADEIRTLFFSFATSVLQHIHRENKVINEILISLYTDEELEQLEVKLSKQLAGEENNGYLRQVVDSFFGPEDLLWSNSNTNKTTFTAANEVLQQNNATTPGNPASVKETLSMQRA